MKTLRQARMTKGYTLDELAALTGCTKPHLSWLENGKVLPSYQTRQRLEINLEEKINWLAPPMILVKREPPATWEMCEREFRYLVKSIASLPDDERKVFADTARKQLFRLFSSTEHHNTQDEPKGQG